MLRIKDPKVSIPFYQKNFGMKLIHWMAFPQWKFTVYFLERQREGQTSPECTMEVCAVPPVSMQVVRAGTGDVIKARSMPPRMCVPHALLLWSRRRHWKVRGT